jgi:hypothetical protein
MKHKMHKPWQRFALAVLVVSILQAVCVHAFADEENEIPTEKVNLVLPSEVPFDIVLPSTGGEGFVRSQEFRITNNGSGRVRVTLASLYVHIEDGEYFAVSEDENPLDTEGSAIHMYLLCSQGAPVERYVLSEIPRDAHTYLLESGESGVFRMGGTVRESKDAPWSNTKVKVSLRFDVDSSDADAASRIAELPDSENANAEDSDTATPEIAADPLPGQAREEVKNTDETSTPGALLPAGAPHETEETTNAVMPVESGAPAE